MDLSHRAGKLGLAALALIAGGLAFGQVAATTPTRPATLARKDALGVPDVPQAMPARFAPMVFENRSGVHVLDWAVAGLPLAIAEKLERVSSLAPAYDAWVVPEGPVVAATPASVAAFAQARAARWVITGWVERPNWQLRLHVAVWRVDGDRAVIAGEREAVGPIELPFALVGATMIGALVDAGWPLAPEAAMVLATAPARDSYAFTLLGRGLGHARGNVGPVDRKAAAKDLARATFIDPELVAAQRLLGLVWSEDPDPLIAKKAAGKFAYAADLDAGYPAAVRAVADRALATGDWPSALTRSAQLVRARPWDLDARVALGLAAWRTGYGDLALRELDRVVARRPDELQAHRVLAEIRGARGETALRIAELAMVVRLVPADLGAQIELGAAYAELGQLPEATTWFERVAAARPDDASAHKRVGDLYRRRGEVDQAITWYASAARLAPNDPRPPLLAGATLLEAGRIAAAREVLTKATKFVDYQAGTLTALGAAAYLEGKHAEALTVWRKAALLRPRSAAIRYDLALAASASGDLARADQQLDVVELLAPNDAGAAYLRGVVRLRAGELEAARTSFAEALVRDPAQADARRNLTALSVGGDPATMHHEGRPRIELPFGDRAALIAALDRFDATQAAIRGLRTQVETHVLGALTVLGEGPTKNVIMARARARAGGPCPLSDVASRQAAARDAFTHFIATGVELEDAYDTIATYDKFGETEGLSPVDRKRVAEAHRGYQAARRDVVELRAAIDGQLGRELTRRHCTRELLAAAAAMPALYRAPETAPRPPAPIVRTEPTPEPATFVVDNSECPDPLSVYVDGVWMGEAPARDKITVQADKGRRTLCLLPEPGSAICGDRGTVREAYLHDGWSLRMRCPKG